MPVPPFEAFHLPALRVIAARRAHSAAAIGRPKLQEFVGALAGQQASKGVFITTLSFSHGAVEFTKAVQQKVILIGGERLADLIIEHKLGVSVQQTIELKRIDSDFFELA